MLFYKAIAGLAGAGVIATGAYGVYELTNPDTISNKISRNGLTLLNTEETSNTNTNPNDDTWRTKVSGWTKGEGVARFTGESLESNNETEKISALKKKCKQVLEELYEEEKYKNFETYCTKQSL